VAVERRPRIEDGMTVAQDEMRARWRDVDVSRRDRLAVLGVLRLELARPPEDLRQDARGRRRQMEDDEEGGGKVRGEDSDQVTQRLDAAGGRTDDDRVEAVPIADLGQDVLRFSFVPRSYASEVENVTIRGPLDPRIERELGRAVDDDEPPRS
jgi:hypothetical protein